MMCRRTDWPSFDGGSQASFTQLHPDYWSLLNLSKWKEFCEQRLGVTEDGKDVPKKFRVRDADRADIKLDDNGIPIWPDEDPEERWPLPVRKAYIREFIKAHYRKFCFVPLNGMF